MTQQVRIAFERKVVRLPLTALLPRKAVEREQKRSVKYKRIASSIAEVGIIEPLAISRLGKTEARYLLLDGHLRLAALQDLGYDSAPCLIANDDEAFTYNKRINQLATVQQHFMILRALQNGASEEKLAKALNVDIKLIKRRQALLDRICPEAVDLLKDKSVNPTTFDVLRKMKPLRQIEVCEFMNSVANWTASYAKALLAATRQDDLARPDQPKKINGMTREQMARMEREMNVLHQDFKQIENSYGDDILHLVISSGYVSKLIKNKEIYKFLDKNYKEILDEFHSITAVASLEQAGYMGGSREEI